MPKGKVVQDETRRPETIEDRMGRVIGEVPPVERSPIGLYTFDRAVGFRGEIGLPSRGIIELYGDEHTGKSTLAYYAMGHRAANRSIVVCDLEASLNKEYIEHSTHVAGHKGEIVLVNMVSDKKKGGDFVLRTHESMLEETIDSLLKPEIAGVLVDSYGAFASAVSKDKKHLGERTMGQEAKTLNQAAIRVVSWIRLVNDPKWYFVINHTSPNIGGQGFTTPGGRKTKYLAIVRAWIRRVESDWPKGTGNFVAEVAIQKLKYGAKGRKGWVYFIPGFGVSREMTAVTDCVKLELAQAEESIKLNVMDGDDKEWKWMSQGRISTLAEKALEPEKNKKTFQPFFDALEKYNVENPV